MVSAGLHRFLVPSLPKTQVHIALDVQDMRSGDQVIVVTGNGTAFTLDHAQSVQKALTGAVIEVVQKLRLWAHG